MRAAWPIALCLVPWFASCKSVKENQKLAEAIAPENFVVQCTQADPSSESAITYRALLKAMHAADCQDAALKIQDLTFLVLNEKNIKDLSPLKNLSQLQWLHLYGNRIEDLSPLSKLVNLKDLVLDNNSISDISAIRDLKNLQELYLGHNKLNKLDALASLTKIYILNLANNQITDVRALIEMKGLMVLDLKGNPLAEVKSPTSCPTGENIAQAIRDFCSH